MNIEELVEKARELFEGHSGAAAAFAVVIVTVLANWLFLHIRLQHASRERALERQGKLRRIVYLKYVEAVTKITSVLAGIANPDFEFEKVDAELKAFVYANGRMITVAPETTAMLAAELSTAFTAILLESAPSRPPITAIRDDLRDTRSARDHISNEITEILSADRRRVLQTGATGPDQGVAAVLQGLLTQQSAFNRRVESLNEKMFGLYAELQASVIQKLNSLRELNARLLVAMRADMGAPTSAKFLDEFLRIQRKLGEQLQSLVR